MTAIARSRLSFINRAAVLIAAGLTTALLAVPGSARADGWSHPAAITGPTAGLVSVSCASSSLCVAVDRGGQAITFDGSSWGAPTQIDAAGMRPLSVSCAPATAMCVAVDDGGNAMVYNSGVWSPPHQTEPLNGLTVVSCPSVVFCMAGDSDGNVLTFNGATWSAPQPVAPPGDQIEDLSCFSATLCAAVTTDGHAMTFNGHTWTTPTRVDGQSLGAISCGSPHFCLAGSEQRISFEWLNGAWTPIPGGAGPGPGTISCPGVLFCAGVSNLFTGHGVFGRVALSDGDGDEAAIGAELFERGHTVTAVGCSGPTRCAAVDSHGQAFVYTAQTALNRPLTPARITSIVMGWLNAVYADFHLIFLSPSATVSAHSFIAAGACPRQPFQDVRKLTDRPAGQTTTYCPEPGYATHSWIPRHLMSDLDERDASYMPLLYTLGYQAAQSSGVNAAAQGTATNLSFSPGQAKIRYAPGSGRTLKTLIFRQHHGHVTVTKLWYP